MRVISILLGALTAATISVTASANPIQVKLICGPHSGDPAKLKAFQANFPLDFSRGVLNGTRELNDDGKETFNGIVAYSGDVLLIGTGSRPTGGAWNYEFHGKARAADGSAMLKGSLRNTSGAVGGRQCTISW